VPGLDGQVVDPDRVDDDPHDREEAERGALRRAEQGLAHRHAEGGHGDDDRDDQRDETCLPGLHLQHAQQHEERHQRDARAQRAQPERPADRVQYLFEHGLTSL
jgi:hypothetical protein